MFPLAVDIPVEGLITAGTVIAFVGVGIFKFFLEHRELKKNEQKKTLSYREVLDVKDAQITSLQNALTKAHADHAVKIQELSDVTISEIKSSNGSNVVLLERVLDRLGEFMMELRKLRSYQFPGEDPPSRAHEPRHDPRPRGGKA